MVEDGAIKRILKWLRLKWSNRKDIEVVEDGAIKRITKWLKVDD